MKSPQKRGFVRLAICKIKKKKKHHQTSLTIWLKDMKVDIRYGSNVV